MVITFPFFVFQHCPLPLPGHLFCGTLKVFSVCSWTPRRFGKFSHPLAVCSSSQQSGQQTSTSWDLSLRIVLINHVLRSPAACLVLALSWAAVSLNSQILRETENTVCTVFFLSMSPTEHWSKTKNCTCAVQKGTVRNFYMKYILCGCSLYIFDTHSPLDTNVPYVDKYVLWHPSFQRRQCWCMLSRLSVLL